LKIDELGTYYTHNRLENGWHIIETNEIGTYYTHRRSHRQFLPGLLNNKVKCAKASSIKSKTKIKYSDVVKWGICINERKNVLIHHTSHGVYTIIRKPMPTNILKKEQLNDVHGILNKCESDFNNYISMEGSIHGMDWKLVTNKTNKEQNSKKGNYCISLENKYNVLAKNKYDHNYKCLFTKHGKYI
jgi:hypothetical protein